MKKLAMILVAGIGLFSACQAQGNKPGHEKIKTLHVAFLTEALQLSPEEAQQFWPVYNQYQAERKTLRKEAKLRDLEAKLNFGEMTEEQAETILNKKLAQQQAELDIRKKYKNEFLKVLPPKKVLRLFAAEKEFHHRMMEKKRESKLPEGKF